MVLGPFLADVPETRRERARGLLGRGRLTEGEAMLFERARSIQTLGMRFAITVAFLDEGFRVIAVRIVRPGRVVWNVRARHVLECSPEAGVRVGDRLTT